MIGPIFPEGQYAIKDLDYILVTGGTEGHKQLFDAVNELGFKKVVLQTGKVDPQPYLARHPEWTIIAYSPEFEKLVAESSLVITHQGGGTIFEAILYKKPLIIVFNTELTRTAGTSDIRVLAAKVGAPFLEHANPKELAEQIRDIDKQNYTHFVNGRVNAVDAILRLLTKKNNIKPCD